MAASFTNIFIDFDIIYIYIYISYGQYNMNIQYISTWEYHGYIYIIYPYYIFHINILSFFYGSQFQPQLLSILQLTIHPQQTLHGALVALYQHLKHLPEKSPSFVAKYTSTMVCIQCEAPKISKLVYNFITPITMVYGTYNYRYWGESKPTNITGGPHIVWVIHNPHILETVETLETLHNC